VEGNLDAYWWGDFDGFAGFDVSYGKYYSLYCFLLWRESLSMCEYMALIHALKCVFYAFRGLLHEQFRLPPCLACCGAVDGHFCAVCGNIGERFLGILVALRSRLCRDPKQHLPADDSLGVAMVQ